MKKKLALSFRKVLSLSSAFLLATSALVMTMPTTFAAGTQTITADAISIVKATDYSVIRMTRE
jgi:hypothetical protein